MFLFSGSIREPSKHITPSILSSLISVQPLIIIINLLQIIFLCNAFMFMAHHISGFPTPSPPHQIIIVVSMQ